MAMPPSRPARKIRIMIKSPALSLTEGGSGSRVLMWKEPLRSVLTWEGPLCPDGGLRRVIGSGHKDPSHVSVNRLSRPRRLEKDLRENEKNREDHDRQCSRPAKAIHVESCLVDVRNKYVGRIGRFARVRDQPDDIDVIEGP